MSRSGVFYAIKAMERTAAGTAAPAAERDAPALARPDGGTSSLARRLLTAVKQVRVRAGRARVPAGS